MPLTSTSPLTLERLLGAGYFPEVLPPCFNSELFGALFAPGKTVPTEFDGDPTKRVPKESKCVRYNQAKVGGLRRQFSIPNPVHFHRLTKFFLAHWPQLEPLAKRSAISLTTPILSGGRHCFRPAVNFELRPSHRARVRASARYILRADVARFFPSLYTHCIPWAIHGKATAKAAFFAGTSGSLFGNELDKRFRDLQDRQSIGIPVGQDVSRVIAEIVLGAVESAMPYRRFPVGMRCIDDYEVGFIRRQDAAEFRNHLERALNEFELALNPLKTDILGLPHGRNLENEFGTPLNQFARPGFTIDDESHLRRRSIQSAGP